MLFLITNARKSNSSQLVMLRFPMDNMILDIGHDPGWGHVPPVRAEGLPHPYNEFSALEPSNTGYVSKPNEA